jgi:Na+/H+-dicarboxylate symporter
MKLVIAIIGWLMFLIPFGFLFILFGLISLEMGFGISPPIGLAAGCFLLALILSLFWRIGLVWKPSLSRFGTKPPKRLLRVQFLREGERG